VSPGTILILSRLVAAGGKYPSLLPKLLFAYPKRRQIFAVGGFVDARARATVLQPPRVAQTMPESGVPYFYIVRGEALVLKV
jgi:hypothetical protein